MPLRDSGRTLLSKAFRAFDAIESFGLVVLLVGLPVSEAAKSAGLFLAVLGFVGKRASGAGVPAGGRGAAAALAAFYLASVASVIALHPADRRTQELLTLAMTIAPFPIVLDACARESRRVLFAFAIVAGAACAAIGGYADYMSGSWLRLVLPSIENAVPAAEYMGAVIALSIAVLFVEWRAIVAGPLNGFALGVTVLALLMTKSRGPMAGAAAGAATSVGLSLSSKRYAFFVVVLLVAAAITFSSYYTDARLSPGRVLSTRTAATRLHVWKTTVDLIAERPLTGYGPGSFSTLGIAYTDRHGAELQQNAHNVLLQVTVESGVLGSGTLLIFLVLGIRGTVRAIHKASWRLDRAVLVGSLAAVVSILAAGAFSVSIDAEPGMLCYALLAMGQPGRR